MASATYDSIVAIIVVGVIFIGTVIALPAINYTNLQTLDQQQLRNTALSVFDTMLLDVGSPSNWGSSGPNFSQNTVKEFGLAYSDPFSKYVLDGDKVQKIDVSNTSAFIEYEYVRKLLNITDYGFQLTIQRPFLTTWNLDLTSNVVHYYLAVTRTEDGTPIPNAEVVITTSLAWTNNTGYDVMTLDPVTAYTNAAGVCEGVQSPTVSGTATHAVSFMRITVAGMSTTVVARNSNPFGGLITIHTSGDTITLSLPEEFVGNNTHSERRILEIDAFKNVLIPLYDGDTSHPPEIKITHGSGYEYWSWEKPGLRYMNPTALLFWAQLTLKGYGRVIVLVAGSLNFGATGEIMSFGPDPLNENPIVVMRRLVVIADMTYVAKLEFWRV